MGDRTCVTLTVPKIHKEEVLSIYKDDLNDPQQSISELDKFVQFLFEEINYGELHGLNILQEKGIAYDSDWSSGDEYGEGCKSCRFTSEGDAIIKEIYENDRGVPIDSLMDLIEAPKALEEYIRTFAEKLKVLPWDNQVEYGKLYRAKKLIDPG